MKVLVYLLVPVLIVAISSTVMWARNRKPTSLQSGVEDFKTDGKWPEYLPYCDAFAFAVAPEFPREILPQEPGLIVADGFGGAILREAPVSPLAGARRKALTLAFARLAALRAGGVMASEL